MTFDHPLAKWLLPVARCKRLPYFVRYCAARIMCGPHPDYTYWEPRRMVKT